MGRVFVKSGLDRGWTIEGLGHAVFHNGFGERVVGRRLDVGVDYSVVTYQIWNIVISGTSIRLIRKHEICSGLILVWPLSIRVPFGPCRVPGHLTAPACFAQALHLNALIPPESPSCLDPRLLALLYKLILPQIQFVLTAVVRIDVSALLNFLQTRRVSVPSTHQTHTVLSWTDCRGWKLSRFI